MHVINHEWNRSMFVASTMCFVWDTKPDLPTWLNLVDQMIGTLAVRQLN